MNTTQKATSATRVTPHQVQTPNRDVAINSFWQQVSPITAKGMSIAAKTINSLRNTSSQISVALTNAPFFLLDTLFYKGSMTLIGYLYETLDPAFALSLAIENTDRQTVTRILTKHPHLAFAKDDENKSLILKAAETNDAILSIMITLLIMKDPTALKTLKAKKIIGENRLNNIKNREEREITEERILHKQSEQVKASQQTLALFKKHNTGFLFKRQERAIKARVIPFKPFVLSAQLSKLLQALQKGSISKDNTFDNNIAHLLLHTLCLGMEPSSLATFQKWLCSIPRSMAETLFLQKNIHAMTPLDTAASQLAKYHGLPSSPEIINPASIFYTNLITILKDQLSDTFINKWMQASNQ